MATGFERTGWKSGVRVKRGGSAFTVKDDGRYSGDDSGYQWWFRTEWDDGRKDYTCPWVNDEIIADSTL